jgi:hypothetical protein
MKPYLLLQRQFEDYDDGVCYIETYELGSYAGHFQHHLVEFAPRGSRSTSTGRRRRVEVTFTLDPQRFQEAGRIICLIFGGKR